MDLVSVMSFLAGGLLFLGAYWMLSKLGSLAADIIVLFFAETYANLKGDTLFR